MSAIDPLDPMESLVEMTEAFDHAIEERDRARGLLHRYLDEHARMRARVAVLTVADGWRCECAICIETRFELSGVHVAHPPRKEDPR